MNTEAMNTEAMNADNQSIASEFEIDPELLDEAFNAPRVPRLTYGIVINDNPAGLFIPEKNLSKAGWIGTPEITELDLAGGKEKGVFFTKARLIVLGAIEPYIRYKNESSLKERGGDPSLALIAIGWYEENKHLLDKSIMDAVSEHLIMFLSESNELLHQRPIRIRFKNVALWSMREALDECYSSAELAFSKLTGLRASGKDDRWRSLVVFDCEFKGVKEGEGGNRSYCCKIEKYQQPTIENLPSLFLGTKVKKQLIWEIFDMNAAGFALSGGMNEPTKSALPPGEDEGAPQLLPTKVNLLKPKA
ncbi:DUF5895 domain-containing protein [Aerosakkonema sp. BLCC-F183]|uniref:DUF5895 domain-containing protein n=1 Tax=Aerosakkonema sp. BLCC-F183 TaxID=3342834 RepID=UPI0035B8744B